MNTLQVGFSRVNITPMLGIPVRGYYIDRFASGVRDELEFNTLAFRAGDDTVLLLSADLCEIDAETLDPFRRAISEATGVPFDNILIHATHTHTGPDIDKGVENALVTEYRGFVCRRAVDAATLALQDLKPARMGWRVAEAKNISFVRRYLMKDGSVRTNPGVNNPDIVKPIGVVDERVNVFRFDQEGGKSLVLVNFGDHPDTIGGDKISADWPGFTRRVVERALDNTRCVFVNGAQGDVNHVNVFPTEGDFNDMIVDFDDVSRGYGHARHMGQVVGGAVLSVYDKVNYVDIDSVRAIAATIDLPSNMPKPEDMAEAYRIEALHKAGRDAELPYEAMMLTTVVAEAERMIRLEHGPENFKMPLSGFALGNFAFFGIPGEPFTGIGMGLKEAKGWTLVSPMCLTNGCMGYFPMQDSYDEGGYESRSSIFKAGVAELIVKEGTRILDELHAKI